ncbi:MAG: alanine dehydrogenase [Bdellovibrionales bacterium]|nr:alanine dehydrogenase [Bdellovibrionales bacterium]
MIIGIPRERKTLEQRVALTPTGAALLVKHGHTVLVEQSAGAGSFFPDELYVKSGATIAKSLEEVWSKAELLVKVKEPHEEEYQYFRDDLILFDYLHLAGLPDVANALLKGGVTSLAYELVQTEDRRLPLLEPMSEIAGKLSVLTGSYRLLSQHGGRGVLLGGSIGVSPAKVVVVGAGKAGRAACEIALGMGADVTVMDISYKQLEYIEDHFGGKPRTVYSNPVSLLEETRNADLVIGAVLVPGAKAPRIITEEIIKAMQAGTVIVDISIDQGGCVENIKTTSLKEPTYIEHDVIHYAVPNMPAQTARTSTQALTAVTLPYVLKIANMGLTDALANDAALKASLSTCKGKLTTKAVADDLSLSYTPIDEALKLL